MIRKAFLVLALLALVTSSAALANEWELSGKVLLCQPDRFTINFRPTGTTEPVSMLHVKTAGNYRAVIWLVGEGSVDLCEDLQDHVGVGAFVTASEGYLDGYYAEGKVQTAAVMVSMSTYTN